MDTVSKPGVQTPCLYSQELCQHMYPHQTRCCWSMAWLGPSPMPMVQAVAPDIPVVMSVQQALWYQYETDIAHKHLHGLLAKLAQVRGLCYCHLDRQRKHVIVRNTGPEDMSIASPAPCSPCKAQQAPSHTSHSTNIMIRCTLLSSFIVASKSSPTGPSEHHAV